MLGRTILADYNTMQISLKKIFLIKTELTENIKSPVELDISVKCIFHLRDECIVWGMNILQLYATQTLSDHFDSKWPNEPIK
jgi:hypothetical protein